MTIITYHFDLLIKNGEEVVLWPQKGEPRKLPKREAQHALAFIGLASPAPLAGVSERIKALGKPLDDAPVHVTSTGVKILRLLGNEARAMLTKEVAAALDVPLGTAGSAIHKLRKQELVTKSITNGPAFNYEISGPGIDWLAAKSEGEL